MANLVFGSKTPYSTIALASLLASSILIQACGDKNQAPPPRETVRPVKTITLGAADFRGSRQFPGTVRASDRVDLSFNVDGPLIELPVKQGQNVKKGDLIARLDPRDYGSNLKAAEARYTETKSNYERGKGLVKDGFISKVQFDQLRSNFEQAEADLAIKKKALNDTYLKAPFAGKIAKRYVQNFQDVRRKERIISLQDVNVIEIVVNAPESIVAGAAGDARQATIQATFESLPGKTFDLEVKEFATEADPKTQTFEYVLIMPQPEDANILPGMTATVLATAPETAVQPTIQVIPALAVVADETGKSHVWVINQKENTAHSREVSTGELVGNDQITITDGLANGDMVAIAGVSTLREGMKVRPVDKIEF
ncbi:efflux RND transporter periplasmic adaptor subunit [Kaarinaea lacus]